MREPVMGQQSVRQAARRSALDAQTVEALAVAVLTSLSERDAAVRDAKGAPREHCSRTRRPRSTFSVPEGLPAWARSNGERPNNPTSMNSSRRMRPGRAFAVGWRVASRIRP